VPAPPAPPRLTGTGANDPANPLLASAWGDSLVLLPIPTIGELYVRYGPGDSRAGALAPALDQESLRRLIREELAALLPRTGDPAPGAQLLDADLRDLESRIVTRLDDILTRRVREESELLRRLLLAEILPEIRGPQVVLTPGVGVPGQVTQTFEAARARDPIAVTLYSGGSAPRPFQLLFGGRADVGPIFPRLAQLRLVPEAAIGVGDGGMTLLAVPNLEFGFGSFYLGATEARPHVGVGLGVLVVQSGVRGLAGTEGVLNAGYGATFALSPRSILSMGPGTRLLVEHQGIDLFSNSRILIGAQRRF
jgi:hypothetical protein